VHQDLLKNTPIQHPDYRSTVAAVHKVREVAAYLNECKKRAEDVRRICDIQQSLVGYAGAVLSSYSCRSSLVSRNSSCTDHNSSLALLRAWSLSGVHLSRKGICLRYSFSAQLTQTLCVTADPGGRLLRRVPSTAICSCSPISCCRRHREAKNTSTSRYRFLTHCVSLPAADAMRLRPFRFDILKSRRCLRKSVRPRSDSPRHSSLFVHVTKKTNILSACNSPGRDYSSTRPSKASVTRGSRLLLKRRSRMKRNRR
jgi:hypothetical protein